MNADQEATSHILDLTAQVNQLKQMATAEAIMHKQMVSVGEDILAAWHAGKPYDEKLHAQWVQATDPKALDKKFKEIAKAVEAEREQLEQAKAIIEKDKAEAKKKPKPAPKP